MKKLHLLLALTTSVVLGACVNHPQTTTDSGRILTYSSTSIDEAPSNDGTFDTEITITLSGDIFVPTLTDGTDYGTINLPDGLTAVLTRDSDTQATLTISGQLTDTNACGTDTASFFFTDSAFESGKSPASFEVPISITYISPTLTFSTAQLDEDSSNIGGFSQNITVTAANGGSFYKNGSPASSGVLTQGDGKDYKWSLPAGLTSTITLTSSTTANVTVAGSATAHTPISDVTTSLIFLSKGLSPGFCTGAYKKDIDMKFYRSIIMYSAGAFSGIMGGRSGADALCTITRPALPTDYDGVKAFITVTAGDSIANLNVPASTKVESTTSGAIADSWTDLLDGSIANSLATAAVVSGGEEYWTGSQDDGTISPGNTCSAWITSSGNGKQGIGDATDTTWLDSGATDLCSVSNKLICIAFVSP